MVLRPFLKLGVLVLVSKVISRCRRKAYEVLEREPGRLKIFPRVATLHPVVERGCRVEPWPVLVRIVSIACLLDPNPVVACLWLVGLVLTRLRRVK